MMKFEEGYKSVLRGMQKCIPIFKKALECLESIFHKKKSVQNMFKLVVFDNCNDFIFKCVTLKHYLKLFNFHASWL